MSKPLDVIEFQAQQRAKHADEQISFGGLAVRGLIVLGFIVLLAVLTN